MSSATLPISLASLDMYHAARKLLEYPYRTIFDRWVHCTVAITANQDVLCPGDMRVVPGPSAINAS